MVGISLSDLPGGSVPWGREIERQISERQSSRIQWAQTLDNGLRSDSGQLTSITARIDSLAERSTRFVDVPTISASGNATSETFPRTSTTISFPPASEVVSSAFFTFSGSISASANIGSATGYLEFRFLGEKFLQLWAQPGSTPFLSSNAVGLRGFSRLVIPAGVSPEVTITLIRRGNSSGSSTISLTGGKASLEYSGVLT